MQPFDVGLAPEKLEPVMICNPDKSIHNQYNTVEVKWKLETDEGL